MRIETRHVAGDEAPVDVHARSRQGSLARLRHVLLDIGQHLGLGLSEADSTRDEVE